MSQYEIDIADMQCWVFRMAQIKWRLSPEEYAAIFKQHDAFGFIERCYDILYLSSYECVLDAVFPLQALMSRQGILSLCP